ncbi:phospholipase D-like domain-containing protein [Haloprofundus salilacus]|uniref:phospholipase D-like domain-containing protein n=1 Tax=Haloprofundus salilacus TaxID=2876190 RepID=UPI001CCD2F55|nr:phospholipase D-like domain-containing protein [Haloprofundus salilacus]
MLDDELYLWLHEEIQATNEVSVDDIPDEYEDITAARNFASEYLDYLSQRGAVSPVSEQKYELQDAEVEREAYYQILDSHSTSVNRVKDEMTYQPVVSIPTRVQTDWEAFADRRNVGQGIRLKDALTEVFTTADSTLRVVAPYFEIDGLNRLEDAFEQSVRSGVELKILTRELLRPSDEYKHNRDRKAILELMDRFAAIDAPESTLSVYDYYHAIGGKNPKLDRSIHAKMAIADETLAYIGSGEIRDSSMMLNGEAGYLTRRRADIKTWTAFFDFFEDKAEKVTREILEEVVEN